VWRTAPKLDIFILQYLRRRLIDFLDIWYAGALCVAEVNFLGLHPSLVAPDMISFISGADIWHSVQQSAVDSAVDGELIFAPGKGPKANILSSENILIV